MIKTSQEYQGRVSQFCDPNAGPHRDDGLCHFHSSRSTPQVWRIPMSPQAISKCISYLRRSTFAQCAVILQKVQVQKKKKRKYSSRQNEYYSKYGLLSNRHLFPLLGFCTLYLYVSRIHIILKKNEFYCYSKSTGVSIDIHY